jgi:transcriptional regulator with XRE-family HTH domain
MLTCNFSAQTPPKHELSGAIATKWQPMGRKRQARADLPPIAVALRRLRTQAGLSAEDVVDAIRATGERSNKTTIYRIEDGTMSPTVRQLNKLLPALGHPQLTPGTFLRRVEVGDQFEDLRVTLPVHRTTTEHVAATADAPGPSETISEQPSDPAVRRQLLAEDLVHVFTGAAVASNRDNAAGTLMELAYAIGVVVEPTEEHIARLRRDLHRAQETRRKRQNDEARERGEVG